MRKRSADSMERKKAGRQTIETKRSCKGIKKQHHPPVQKSQDRLDEHHTHKNKKKTTHTHTTKKKKKNVMSTGNNLETAGGPEDGGLTKLSHFLTSHSEKGGGVSAITRQCTTGEPQ